MYIFFVKRFFFFWIGLTHPIAVFASEFVSARFTRRTCKTFSSPFKKRFMCCFFLLHFSLCVCVFLIIIYSACWVIEVGKVHTLPYDSYRWSWRSPIRKGLRKQNSVIKRKLGNGRFIWRTLAQFAFGAWKGKKILQEAKGHVEGGQGEVKLCTGPNKVIGKK